MRTIDHIDNTLGPCKQSDATEYKAPWPQHRLADSFLHSRPRRGKESLTGWVIDLTHTHRVTGPQPHGEATAAYWLRILLRSSTSTTPSGEKDVKPSWKADPARENWPARQRNATQKDASCSPASVPRRIKIYTLPRMLHVYEFYINEQRHIAVCKVAKGTSEAKKKSIDIFQDVKNTTAQHIHPEGSETEWGSSSCRLAVPWHIIQPIPNKIQNMDRRPRQPYYLARWQVASSLVLVSSLQARNHHSDSARG